MTHSSTLYLGLAVHTDAIAVASVAKDHDADGTYLGTVGTRHGDIDSRIRERQSKAPHLVFADEAGPCGAWRYRYLTNKGYDGWVVAPSFMPKQAGDRVKTERRDAVPRARLMRSGDLTRVDVPAVAGERRSYQQDQPPCLTGSCSSET